jgi:multiple sugar transport system substrate-binding protein
VFVEICAAFGCQVVDAKGNVVIDSPQTAQAIEYYKQLWKTTTPDAISKTNLDQRLVFAAGGAAIMMTQISLVTNLTSGQSKVSLDQAAVVEVPNQAKTRPTTVNEIQALTIPRGAKHPAEARRFLEFWFSPDEYMKYISNTVPGHLPTMKHATAATSPYWELPRIKPMASLFRVASESAFQNGFYLGMHPVPNTCEPKVYAAGIYTQMVSHAVIDNWGGAQTAAWAQTEIKRLCAR